MVNQYLVMSSEEFETAVNSKAGSTITGIPRDMKDAGLIATEQATRSKRPYVVVKLVEVSLHTPHISVDITNQATGKVIKKAVL